MPRSKKPTVSLEEAKARFEEWRRKRQGKASIPDELWAAAVEVARKEGVSRTSTELRVEWNHLKRRMIFGRRRRQLTQHHRNRRRQGSWNWSRHAGSRCRCPNA
jgi:N-acyl-L-homoserine lactone synthetase